MLHIIIPVYNEKDNIARTLAEIEACIQTPCDIAIVYDFEEDDTLPAARAYLEQAPHLALRFVRNPRRGVVSAIGTGLATVQEGAALVMMADLSDDLRAVDGMMSLMEQGYDVVCGSRYMRGGRQIGGPRLKGFLSRMAGLSLHWLTGIPTHDISNSFKMYSARLLQSITLESVGGFEIGLEILVKCYVAGGRITEVPSTWRDRTAGESRFKLWQWLPHYLRWYWYALSHRWTGRIARRPRA